jgi:transcriptional regulator with XRE-family HTH domain
MGKYDLTFLRAELSVDQTALARESGIDQSTISRIERGQRTRPDKAMRILLALNRLRGRQQLPPLAFEEINWHISSRTRPRRKEAGESRSDEPML